MVYDPVPPYDLDDDVEANRPNRQQDTEDHDRDGDRDNVDLLEIEDRDVTKDNGCCCVPRKGRLSEKQCCKYAFAYFAATLISLVLIVLIISHYAYLSQKRARP